MSIAATTHQKNHHGQPGQIPGRLPVLIIKQRVDSSLLAEIGQRLEKTGLAQMHAVTLAVMLRAVPPKSLQGAKLLAVARHTRGFSTHGAVNVGIGLRRLTHHDHS